MKARLLRMFLAVVLVAGGYVWGNHSATTVHAQGRTNAMPKSWGKVVGVLPGVVVFEDTTGTLRLVQMNQSAPDLTITRN